MAISVQKKVEIIDRVLHLDDATVLRQLSELKDKLKPVVSTGKKRQFGCGKDLFTYIANDFNAPLPEFKAYTS